MWWHGIQYILTMTFVSFQKQLFPGTPEFDALVTPGRDAVFAVICISKELVINQYFNAMNTHSYTWLFSLLLVCNQMKTTSSWTLNSVINRHESSDRWCWMKNINIRFMEREATSSRKCKYNSGLRRFWPWISKLLYLSRNYNILFRNFLHVVVSIETHLKILCLVIPKKISFFNRKIFSGVADSRRIKRWRAPWGRFFVAKITKCPKPVLSVEDTFTIATVIQKTIVWTGVDSRKQTWYGKHQ